MAKYLSKVLYNEEELKSMVKSLGKRISEDYAGKNIIIIGVLKGAFVFLADLVREIDVVCNVDFISVSSYGDAMQSSGEIKIQKDCDIDITDKHVLIVEDVIDTGYTLKHLMELLKQRNPASLALCVAFDKPNRKVDLEADYVGIKIGDEFIVGYGLDYRGQYRNLPELCVIGEDGLEEEN